MKKVILVASLGMFALTACKKDYTCECSVSSNGVSAVTSTTTINDTKKKATDACEAAGSTVLGVTTTCAIK